MDSFENENPDQVIDGKFNYPIIFNCIYYFIETVLCININTYNFYVLIDSITAVEYNADGEYLATGDRVGRITVLKLENEGKVKVSNDFIHSFVYI